MTPLPISRMLPEILTTLQGCQNLVLQAPPGTGKTTLFPKELVASALFGKGKILLLEPRRLAAVRSAHRIAELLGESVGERVGYRIRGTHCVSSSTILEIITEGILINKMREDPSLAGVSLVLFDEFHERNLFTDLGLALAHEIQQTLRTDLKIVVMSATLDAHSIATLLGAKIISISAPTYPVEVRYGKSVKKQELLKEVASTVIKALRDDDGDILVFLPGVSEIRAVQKQLQLSPINAKVFALYGDLSIQEQQNVLSPKENAHRRVILSTSVAETSITVEGVRVVIDSGLTRTTEYDPSSGMSSLTTVSVSQASAAQRAGRAGRLSPGVCYRLWNQDAQSGLKLFNIPEIERTDLTYTVLELAWWGIKEPASLSWISPLPDGAYKNAQALLQSLELLTNSGEISPLGKKVLTLPCHPRLATMIVRAHKYGYGERACDIAALIDEREKRCIQTDALEYMYDELLSDKIKKHHHRFERTIALSQILKRSASIRNDTKEEIALGTILAWAYPDRIAMRRENYSRNYLLSNGSGASVHNESALHSNEWLVCGEVSGATPHAKIHLAASTSLKELKEFHPHLFKEREENIFDKKITTTRVVSLGAIIISTIQVQSTAEGSLSKVFAYIEKKGAEHLPWSEQSLSLITRSEWARIKKYTPEVWPMLTWEYLQATLDAWLIPYLAPPYAITAETLSTALCVLVPYELKNRIDKMAPENLELPSGRKVPIEYDFCKPPTIASRVQDFFGLDTHPCIANGKEKLVVELLSPARRPVQITQDLPGFWRGSYKEVKKELKPRYPKHAWPDEPWKY